MTERAWELTHHLIRKTGHFIGYGLVALAWLRAFWMTFPRLSFFRNASLALLGTAVTASADEIHQTFLPNRTGLARDVVLDCCGAIFMQFAFFLLLKLTSRTWFERPRLILIVTFGYYIESQIVTTLSVELSSNAAIGREIFPKRRG